MLFSYQTYSEILKYLTIDKGYKPSHFEKYEKNGMLYLRHDIDIFIEGTLEMAKIEKDFGIFSTWFILVDSEFYNPLSKDNRKMLLNLNDMGHKIGLHIDTYFVSDLKELPYYIERLYDFYSQFLPLDRVISFHRPIREILEGKVYIRDFVSTYDKRFFKEIIYVSDSGHRDFYEDLINKVEHNLGKSIQLLIHPYWWDYKNLDLIELKNRFLRIKEKKILSNLARETKIYNKILNKEVYRND